jgi:hypothetical protein
MDMLLNILAILFILLLISGCLMAIGVIWYNIFNKLKDIYRDYKWKKKYK